VCALSVVLVYDVEVHEFCAGELQPQVVFTAKGIRGVADAHGAIAAYYSSRRSPGTTPGHTAIVTCRRVEARSIHGGSAL
jgi:hypothetical protein